MTNTLVVGYGGYGITCASAYAKECSLPVLLLDSRAFLAEEFGIYQDCIELVTDDVLNEGRICNVFSNYRNILFILPLGGDSFTHVHSLISRCATAVDASLITLCTIPYSFESERRSRAMSTLDSLPQEVDNLFILDLQRTITEKGLVENLDVFLRLTEEFVVRTIGVLAQLLERYPFFSYCTDRAYTLAIGSGLDYPAMVADALEHPYFEIRGRVGKILLCSDAHPTSFELDSAIRYLSARSSSLPEVMGTSGMGEDKVLLLIPISFQCE
ncbi:MAG: hypothetical protein MJZ38_01360 [archaeon]|nr:hypothetical protein [archaeon]